MFLGDVGNFMGHHAGKFTFGVGVQDHAAVDADNAAGRGKCIDQGVVDDKERKLLFVVIALGHQAVSDRFDIGVDFGVGYEIRLFPHPAEKRLSQPPFELRAQQPPGRIADIRQVQGRHFGGGRGTQEHDQEQVDPGLCQSVNVLNHVV